MTATAPHPHRVSRAVAGMHASCEDITDVPLWSMDPAEAAETLQQLVRLEGRIAELKTRVLQRVDQTDLPASVGATSTANWLAHQTKATRRATHRWMRLAQGLDRHDDVRTALAQGALQVQQAEVILRGLAELPDDLDAGVLEQAETQLVAEAEHFDANALTHLAHRVLEVVAPDVADAHEAKILEKEERDAAAATRLRVWEDGHGKVHGRFTLDGLTGAMFKKQLLARAAPKHRAADGPLGERLPTPERMGRAFAELIQRNPTTALPKAGGLNATVVVLMPLDTLIGGLKAAHLDTGGTISPSLARKLAGEAGILPAVLDGDSRVLDLGRKKRFHSEAQRIVATIEQRRCHAEGCDWPPGMSHMHHPIPWALDGGTDRDGMLLCPKHHSRAHDPAFTMSKLPTGRVTFHRRT